MYHETTMSLHKKHVAPMQSFIFDLFSFTKYATTHEKLL